MVGCAGTHDAPRRPNVVIFLTDDQGALDVNCYGSNDLYTPNMDRLAREGVRFTQAYAHPVCCPARAMLMTGRVPQRSGIVNWTQANMHDQPGRNMPLSEVTLAEVLNDAGYRTALFGKWHLGAAETNGPTRQGFETFFGLRGGFIDNYVHFAMHGKGFHDLYEGTQEVFRRGEYFPDLMTTRVKDYIQTHKDEPFFVYCAFNIPHYPEEPDAKFDERYKDLPMPRRSYAKMVSTVDDRIGQVLGKLDELGLTDDTIIVFMSDNGYSSEDYQVRYDDHNSGLPKGFNYGANGGGGNTGKWRGSKGTMYEGGLRVPAMMRYPRMLGRGVVRDQAVTACDVMPTLLELCGVDRPAGVTLDGDSLLPIMRDNAPTHHAVLHWGWQGKWAVREGDWKLIGQGDKPIELVNLAEDLPERVNHLEERWGLVSHLSELHDKWMREVTLTP